MAMLNPYQQYQNNQVNTATPGELTLLLYNGAVKFCKQAIQANEEEDIQKTNLFIQKVQAIITELTVTLDTSFEVGQNLAQVYDYINYRLLEANINKSTEMLIEACGMLEELRDTWAEAIKLAKQQ
ncbi:MAG: flagellar export chaperone FliS [Desulfitobacterium hafniense]|nr:flagellar export chaperone FliS [Desulfitobacterium hafniense]